MVYYNEYEQVTNEDLLADYKRTNSLKMKQELALRYIELVKSIVYQMRGTYISFADADDMINECMLTLMNIIDKFDAGKNVKLETYAVTRIRGTIIDLARKQDWLPRSVRKRAKEIEAVKADLYEKNGTMPSDSEIASQLGLTSTKYYKTLRDMELRNLVSLDFVRNMYSDSINAKPISGYSDEDDVPLMQLQKKEIHDSLQNAMNSLNSNERRIISLYYLKELKMREIARIINVSEPRVSQLHSSALRKLRRSMETYLQ